LAIAAWISHVSPLVHASTLSIDSVQTSAICDPSFSWMDNSLAQSPCYVAAYVQSACGTGDWTVKSLPANSSYTPPDTTTANGCTCSWATYNLLSACTVCQSQNPYPWSYYSNGCQGFLSSSTYFPANATLNSQTALPFWAVTNPSTWPNTAFSATQAKSIVGQAHPDITQSQTAPTPGKRTVPIGPIVGGVIGGLVVIALAATVIICLILKYRKQKNHPGQVDFITPTKPMIHDRSLSDTSQMTLGPTLSSHVPMSNFVPGFNGGSLPMTTQGVTHPPGLTHSTSTTPNGHGHAVSWDSSITSPSPPPHSSVEPFTAFRTQPEFNEKSQARMLYAQNMSPSPPPLNSAAIASDGSTNTPTHRRYNPPAYTTYAESSPGSGSVASGSVSRRPREKTRNGSVDSHTSSANSSEDASLEYVAGLDTMVQRIALNRTDSDAGVTQDSHA